MKSLFGYLISIVIVIFWAMNAWNEFERTGNTSSLSIVFYTSLMFLVISFGVLTRIRTYDKEN